MSFFDTAWYIGNGSSPGYASVPTWPGTSQTVTAGAWCRQLATPTTGNERCFVAIVGGTTNSSAEPTWTVTRGAITTDGSVSWQEATGMAGTCGDLTNCPLDTAVKSATVTLGQIIQNTAGTYLFICSTGGTTSASPPTWNTTTGNTTTWNSSSVWTCIGPVSSYTTAFGYPHARCANAFASTWGIAGNTFAVASNHAETQSTSISAWGPPSAVATPASVYCISSSTTLAAPTLATSASVATTGASNITFSNFYGDLDGINFSAGSGSSAAYIVLGGAPIAQQIYNCTYTLNNTSSGSNITPPYGGDSAIYYGCSFNFGAASQYIKTSGGLATMAKFIGCTVAGTGTIPTNMILGSDSYFNLLFEDCNLSGITTSLSSGALTYSNITFENCSLGSGVTISSCTFVDSFSFVKLHNCDSAATNYRYYYANLLGVVQQETTHVRAGGATNGTTPISWNVLPTSSAKSLAPFVSEEIAQWNATAGTAMTAVCYLTTNSSLTNATFWIEIEYLSSSSNPLGATVNTRMAFLGTPAALPMDGSSTWGGSALSNKYVITSPSFTPQMAGPVKMRIYVGAASTSNSIYVDPNIYLSSGQAVSRSEFVPGWGMINETGSSGGGSFVF